MALLGLACVVYRSEDDAAAAATGNALAVQSLASSGFKVIAGWESQHHAYARKCPRVPQGPAVAAASSCCAALRCLDRCRALSLCVTSELLPSLPSILPFPLTLPSSLSPSPRQTTSKRSLWTRGRPGN